MTLIDLYQQNFAGHSFGGQGKAVVEIVRWGILAVKMHKADRVLEKRQGQLRVVARKNIQQRVPELRLHISGERYYVYR